MKKQEFLAMSLPYGLKVYRKGLKKEFFELIGERFSSEFLFEDATYIPIVRPLSDLTKTIVQANYNDGKPFIPIDEIEGEIGFEWCDAYDEALANLYRDTDRALRMPFKFVQLFIQWHFDLITEECKKVYVTDEFNPYK